VTARGTVTRAQYPAPCPPAGNLASYSTLTGALTTPVALTGTLTSVSTFTGTVFNASVSLAGSLTSTSALTATLTTGALTASLLSTSILAGTVRVQVLIAGSITSVSTLGPATLLTPGYPSSHVVVSDQLYARLAPADAPGPTVTLTDRPSSRLLVTDSA